MLGEVKSMIAFISIPPSVDIFTAFARIFQICVRVRVRVRVMDVYLDGPERE